MSWENTYISLAINFDATLSDRPNDVDYLFSSLLDIIDLNTVGIGSELSFGTEGATFLLPKMDHLYRTAFRHYSYNDERNIVVEAINDFTVKYFGDLTSFINKINWPDGCVPFYWAELTENGSHDTSGWTVCS